MSRTAPPRVRRARALAVSVLVVTVATQPFFLLGTGALQAGPDLGYGVAELGIFTALFFLVAAVVSARAGRIVESIGWPSAMRIAAGGAAAVLISMATIVRGTAGLYVALVVAAIAYGFANPAANLALARVFPLDQQGMLFGLKHAGIPASTLLAGIAVPSLMLQFGWRWAFAVSALGASAVFVALPGRAEPPSQVGSASTAEQPREMSRLELRLMAVAAGLAVSAPSALATFSVPAGVDAGLSEAAAGLTISVASLTSILARVAIGRVADLRRSTGVSLMAALLVVGAGFVALLGVAGGTAFAVALVVSFATAWGWPGLMTFSVVSANPGRPAAASAVVQAGVFVGAAVAPIGFGWLAQRGSYQVAWNAVAFGLLASALVLTAVARRFPRR